MTNYTKKAVRGAFSSHLFLVLSSVLAILLRVVLARSLSVDDFGLFYAVLALVAMFTFLRDLGLSEAQVWFIPQFLHKRLFGRIKGIVYLVLSVQTVSGTVFLIASALVSNFLALHYFRSALAADVIVLMALWFFLNGIEECIVFAFNATQKIFLQTSMEFVHLLMVLGGTLLLLRSGWGIHAPAAAYVASTVVTCIVYFAVLRRTVFPYFSKVRRQLTAGHIKEYLKYSLPIVPATATAEMFFSKISLIFLTYFGTLHQVGLYVAALSVSRLSRLIYYPIQNVLFPISSELWVKGKSKHLSKGIALLYKYSLIVALPLVAAIIVFPEEILRVFFGAEYVAARPVLQLLAVAMSCMLYTTIASTTFLGIGESGWAAKISGVGGGINILVGLMLIPTFKMYGAAIAFLVAMFCMMTYSNYSLHRFVPIRKPWKEWALTGVASGGFILTILVLKRVLDLWVGFEIAACLAAASLVYVLFLFLLRVTTIEESKGLARRVLSAEPTPGEE